MKLFKTDFKDSAIEEFPLDRTKWDDHRHLFVEICAKDEDAARDMAFNIAAGLLKDPFMGGIEEIEQED